MSKPILAVTIIRVMKQLVNLHDEFVNLVNLPAMYVLRTRNIQIRMQKI